MSKSNETLRKHTLNLRDDHQTRIAAAWPGHKFSDIVRLLVEHGLQKREQLIKDHLKKKEQQGG